MPYIETKASVKITDEQKRRLKEEFGRAIELIPGKSEEWLMLGFVDGMTMSFRGDMSTPAVMIEVDILGKASTADYDALTEKLTVITSNILAVPSDRIYIKYSEYEHWGYNGFNF